MTRMIRGAVMAVCLVTVSGIASADTLVLRDGTRIDGTVGSFTARTVTFVHGDGVSRRYATSEIASLEFLSAERANPRAPRSSLEAPAGAQFVVQAIEMIDSRNAGADQTYAAIFQQSVTDAENRVVIPKGASAQLIIRHLSNFNERADSELALDVRSIAIDGQKYLVNSWERGAAEPAVVDKNTKRTSPIGGGVTLGSILGALSGGTGAASSQPGGNADAQVLTRGRDVRIPADTVLVFRVDKRVFLQRDE